jgi:hypothetical protein
MFAGIDVNNGFFGLQSLPFGFPAVQWSSPLWLCTLRGCQNSFKRMHSIFVKIGIVKILFCVSSVGIRAGTA